jgi:hypothetical protein
MKRLFLLSFSIVLIVVGWTGIEDYAWVQEDAPRWNPFAIKESGLGRTFARVLTEQANTSYHHGLFEQRPPIVANPFSKWLDAGTSSLGFQGRLKYRPVDQYPLHPYEVKQALEQAESKLRLAFELDPGNYTAYDVYLFFLTTQINQTEFASLNGTQMKDNDDQPSDADPASKTAETVPKPDQQAEPPQQQQRASNLYQWAEKERQRRQAKAIEITDEAIRKFRPNTLDPERYLTGATMWYNRFLILAPQVEDRRRSEPAREKFEQIGLPTLSKMRYYIHEARTCEQDLQNKGLWFKIPERRKEFLLVARLMEKSADALGVALQINRSQMHESRIGSNVWMPPGSR